MILLQTVAAAFSVFSRIPVPRTEWTEKNLRYMLCAFPLVGAVIGLLLWGWSLICLFLGFGRILFAAGLTLLPVLVTGGIHLDGFCDTTDALASNASPERRREILKDTHTGAFAVIGVAAYLLLYFALATEVSDAPGTALTLGLMHVLSRTLSGLAVLLFPASTNKGMLAAFKESAAKRNAAAVLLVLFTAAAGSLLWLSWPAASMVLAALLCLLGLRRMAHKKFNGMSGDLAGWFLQTAELAMLAALIITEKVVAL
jgi:adenosylcobinamide-GDP ribazoletransferase